MARLRIASPHRYADLARLWHRWVMRELAPAFAKQGLDVGVDIFCDANVDGFGGVRFLGARLHGSGAEMRDFMEFYDAALQWPGEFILFLDADTFVMDGEWAASYFAAFEDEEVAAISFVPRRGAPAIFALLCRAGAYRELPQPVLACRHETPDLWPQGANPQPGDVAVRELAKRGKKIVNIGPEESLEHVVNFRGTTGIRSTREHITRAAGEDVFWRFAAGQPAHLAAAYDNVLLGTLYEALFGEAFAADEAGRHCGSSMTLDDLRRLAREVREVEQKAALEEKFARSRFDIARMAEREGLQLTIPSLDMKLGS